MVISIDTQKIADLSKDGDKILLSAEGEKSIAELYEMQALIEQAVSDAKKKIQESAIALDPNFTSIQGDKVKVSYRAYGARYRIDQSKIAEIPKDFYETTVRYAPVVKTIESYVDKQGALPVGVLENAREKQIQITIKEAK